MPTQCGQWQETLAETLGLTASSETAVPEKSVTPVLSPQRLAREKETNARKKATSLCQTGVGFHRVFHLQRETTVRRFVSASQVERSWGDRERKRDKEGQRKKKVVVVRDT